MAKRPVTRPRADRPNEPRQRIRQPTPQPAARRTPPVAAAPTAPPPVPLRAGLDLRFDVTNPRAVEFARTRSAELVTNVLADTKAAIRAIIGDGFAEGRTTRQMAKEIRQVVGLTPRHADAVTNLRARLEKQGVEAETIDART